MAIETICIGCSKRLRVGDEHSGKQARCPQCQTTYTVPAPAAAEAGNFGHFAPPTPTADRWQLKTGDGLAYGPVSRAELDRWLTEGRVTPQSQVLQEGAGQWRWAGEIYPQLAAATSPNPGNPFVETPGQPVNPYATSYAPGGAAFTNALYDPVTGAYLAPHRGALILVLGILGLAFCALLGIPALFMGLHDLKQIRERRMDRNGRGLTIAGAILGGVGLAIMALQIVILGGMLFVN